MMKKMTLIITLFVSILTTGMAFAGQYKLVKGEQFELCRKYEENLNRFSKEPPMVCGRKIHAGFKNFSKPEWKPLNLEKNLDLIEQKYRIDPMFSKYPESKIDKAWLDYKERLLKNYKSGQAKLSVAQFDYNFDGQIETVMRLKDRSCDPKNKINFISPAGNSWYFVVEPIQRKVFKPYVIRGIGAIDSFFYKDRIYIDKWNGFFGAKKGMLEVYETSSPRFKGNFALTSVCRFKYSQ